MRTLVQCLLHLAVIAIPFNAGAQGTINVAPQLCPGIRESPEHGGGLVSHPMTLSLYWAPGGVTDPDSFLPTGPPFALIGSGNFQGGIRSLPGVIPGSSVNLLLRAWEPAFPTYEEAAGTPGAEVGTSPIVSYVTGGPSQFPTPPPLPCALLDFQLRIVPEPAVPDPVVVEPGMPLTLSLVDGGILTFGLQLTNTAAIPVSCQWRRGDSDLGPVQTTDSLQSFLTVSNLPASAVPGDEFITVVVSNAAAVLIHTNAVLVFDPDLDGDFMSDSWELAHGLDPQAPAQQGEDSDSDGYPDRLEYESGTDPRDRSNLLIDALDGGPRFEGVAGSTYGVVYTHDIRRPGFGPGGVILCFTDPCPGHPDGSSQVWHYLTNVVARVTNRVVQIEAETDDPRRFYRIVTPAIQPPVAP